MDEQDKQADQMQGHSEPNTVIQPQAENEEGQNQGDPMPSSMSDTKQTSNMESQATSQQTGMAEPQKKSKKAGRSLKSLIIALVAIVLIGGGAFAAISVVKIFNKSPQSALNDGIAELLKMEDVQADINLQSEGIDFALNLKANLTQPAGEVGFNLTIPETELTPESDATISIRALPESYYLNISGVGKVIDAGINNVLDDVDSSEVNQLVGGIFSGLSNLDNSWYEINSETISELFPFSLGSDETPDISFLKLLEGNPLDQISEAYTKNPFVIVNEELGEEEINGVKAMKLSITQDNEAIDRMVDDLASRNIGIDFDAESLKAELRETVDERPLVDAVRVWIDVAGGHLLRIEYDDGAGNGYEIEFINGQGVTIDVPEDAQPIDSDGLNKLLFSGLSTGSASLVQAQSMDTERQSDINSIRAQLEAYYASNGFYPSTPNFSNLEWVTANMPGINTDVLTSPQGSPYSYEPGGCIDSKCANYSLSADLEEDGLNFDDVDGDTKDYVKDSLNDGIF